MGVFVALYRGINVLGKNSVPMAALRGMHQRLGHRDVQSYIQSGNVVFSAKGSAAGLARQVAAEFAQEFGFAAKLVVVDAKRWEAIARGNPYGKLAAKNHKVVHVGICVGQPSAKSLAALLAKTGGREKFVVRQEIVYLHAPDGYGTSKFAAGMERACGVPMTVRNARTVEALRQLACRG